MSLAEKLYLIAKKDDTISDKETELAQQMDKILVSWLNLGHGTKWWLN